LAGDEGSRVASVDRLAGEPVGRATWLFHALALVIVAASLLVNAWVATDVFDRLPHVEDEQAILFDARAIAGGALVPPLPELHHFFLQPFVLVEEDYWYGIYPPGFPLALSLGVLAGHPWIVNPIVAALSVGLIYLAGLRLYRSPQVGLLAAAMLALSPFTMLQAGSHMAHVTALFWITAFTLLFDWTRRRGAWWLAALAGLAIGMAFLIRPLSALAVVVPFVVWVLIDLIRTPRAALRVYPAMAAAGSLGGLAYIWYNLRTTGDPFLTGQEAMWDFNRVGFGDGIGPGGYHGFEGGVLVTRVNLEHLSHWLYGWPDQLSFYAVGLGIAVMLASFLWRVIGLKNGDTPPAPIDPGDQRRSGLRPVSPEAWDLALFTLGAAIILAHAAYWTTGFMYGPRFFFEAMGALVLLSARGLLGLRWLVVEGIRLLVPRLPGLRPVVTLLGLAFLAFLFYQAHTDFTPAWLDEYRGWYDIDRAGLERVEAAGLENAVVIVLGQHWTDFAPYLAQNSPFLTDDVLYARGLGEGANRMLLDRFPGRSIYQFDGETLAPWEPAE
jgi:hypothetical protein